jgi:hypothetical protein
MSGEIQQFQRQPSGKHQVRVGGSQSEEVIVENGAITHVAFGAKSTIDNTGRLPVGTLVLESIYGSSGDVYVDEMKVGHLDANRQITIASLTVGPHRYRVSGQNTNSSKDFEIRANQTTRFLLPSTTLGGRVSVSGAVTIK